MSSQKKTSFSLLFYPSKTKLKKNGEAPVLMKININGNRIVLNTKRSVNPTAWNSVKGRMGGRTQEAKEFNDYIDAIILRTRQKYSELLTQHDVVTPEMLRDAVLGVHTAQARMLLEVFEEHIENMRKLIGKETTKATCQKYGTCKAHLQKFLKEEYRASDIPVKSVDYYFVEHHGQVLYCAIEKGFGYIVKEKIERLGAALPRLFIAGQLPKSLESFDFVFIDSVSKAGMDLSQLEALRKDYPRTSFIFIYHTTKEGRFRGENAHAHEVDVIVQVENGLAKAKGRFGGGKLQVMK